MYAEKLRGLCPVHKREKKDRKGFRCICIELNQAFAFGIRAINRRSGRKL